MKKNKERLHKNYRIVERRLYGTDEYWYHIQKRFLWIFWIELSKEYLLSDAQEKVDKYVDCDMEPSLKIIK